MIEAVITTVLIGFIASIVESSILNEPVGLSIIIAIAVMGGFIIRDIKKINTDK